jgi:sphingolipid 4-desaturase/C4-monooxygenase
MLFDGKTTEISLSTYPQVGYHNEHHDFPSVAWTRLPKLRALAPEFYDTLPSHPSWPMVIVNFIRDVEVGMHSRVKRVAKETKAAATADVQVTTSVKPKDD